RLSTTVSWDEDTSGAEVFWVIVPGSFGPLSMSPIPPRPLSVTLLWLTSEYETPNRLMPKAWLTRECTPVTGSAGADGSVVLNPLPVIVEFSMVRYDVFWAKMPSKLAPETRTLSILTCETPAPT